jgi:hypothetical protein
VRNYLLPVLPDETRRCLLVTPAEFGDEPIPDMAFFISALSAVPMRPVPEACIKYPRRARLPQSSPRCYNRVSTVQ